MTMLQSAQATLAKSGWSPVRATIDGGRIEALVLSLGEDAAGRARDLFIEDIELAAEDGRETHALSFAAFHPYAISDIDAVPDLLRVLLLLNRIAPLGSHHFCEETPGVYFSYLLMADPKLADHVLIRTVEIIADCLAAHGMLIERVARGAWDSEAVFEELDRMGGRPRAIANILSS